MSVPAMLTVNISLQTTLTIEKYTFSSGECREFSLKKTVYSLSITGKRIFSTLLTFLAIEVYSCGLTKDITCPREGSFNK